MPQEITKQRWESAQTEELRDHIYGSYDLNFYKNIYNNIFSLLEMNPNEFEEKTIAEIGPALYPCLADIKTNKSIAVEPLYDLFPLHIKQLYIKNNISCISEPLEKIQDDQFECDEIWVFNVMQHIIDPNLFINKCISFFKIFRS